MDRPFGFLSAPPVRGAFVYFAFPCWVLVGVNVPPPERLPEPHGTQRNGKIEKLRIESGILRIPGSPFRFAFCFARPRRFRLFIISALGVER